MLVLVAIALKSVIVAGGALGVLALLRRRSAAERSWVAHLGLLGLVLVAVAPLVLPTWAVETPALLAPTPAPVAANPTADMIAVTSVQPKAVTDPKPAVPLPSLALSPAALTVAAYALPAAILLLITFLALARLIALRARAEVLVDGHWLSALARAQKRMGFKHGTALLTSDELASPISWGLMRPVILLNTRAVEASGEAEAIIAHELAHVARMDWVKLLLARVATALFWFNPLVWMLAREAHQLREEAADDAVLGADIPDTDYAQLLVGVARHECPGLLLGAHGVAPSKGSLARRVARVLDGASMRGPVARSFALGVLVGSLLIAAPLAALTFTPAGMSKQEAREQARPSASAAEPTSPYYAGSDVPTDLPHIIADGVSASVATAVAAVNPYGYDYDEGEIAREAAEASREAAMEAREKAAEIREAAREAGRAGREAGRAGREAGRAAREAALGARSGNAIDRVIEMKAVGVTADYVAAMRAAAPRLARLDASDFVGMKAVGVTPQFTRELVAAGLRNIDEDELTEARAVGLNGAYVRAMRAAGVIAGIDEYVELWTVGVKPDFVRSVRAAGHSVRDVDQLVEMQALGVTARDLRTAPPRPPRPTVPPRNWDPDADPADD